MKLIELSKNGKKNKGKYFAQVDDADFEWLNGIRWHVGKKKRIGFEVISSNNVSMHRMIMGIYDLTIEVDHIDFNGLNNQRNNIRCATHQQNMLNRMPRGNSKYLGVHQETIRRIIKSKGNITREYKYFRARIDNGIKYLHLGNFKIEEDAARAYDKAAKEIHGVFANLNFKEEVPTEMIGTSL